MMSTIDLLLDVDYVVNGLPLMLIHHGYYRMSQYIISRYGN